MIAKIIIVNSIAGNIIKAVRKILPPSGKHDNYSWPAIRKIYPCKNNLVYCGLAVEWEWLVRRRLKLKCIHS